MKRGKSAAASSTAKSRKKTAASMGLSLETPTRVFISYRREDTADAVAHLHHSLAQQLGEGKVLQGGRRLDAREDFVRKEIESALAADVQMIPVLVDGARMPDRKQLPESIKKLAGKNGYELPWLAGILKLGSRIQQIEEERQRREA